MYGNPPSDTQIALAASVGITDIVGLSAYQLSRKIDEAPATQAQINYVRILLDETACRQNLTFGQASKLIYGLEPIRNERALLETGWQEGDILMWNNRYHRIKKIHAGSYDFTLIHVDLQPHEKSGYVIIEHRTRAGVGCHSPFRLQDEKATKVDVSTLSPM